MGRNLLETLILGLNRAQSNLAGRVFLACVQWTRVAVDLAVPATIVASTTLIVSFVTAADIRDDSTTQPRKAAKMVLTNLTVGHFRVATRLVCRMILAEFSSLGLGEIDDAAIVVGPMIIRAGAENEDDDEKVTHGALACPSSLSFAEVESAKLLAAGPLTKGSFSPIGWWWAAAAKLVTGAVGSSRVNPNVIAVRAFPAIAIRLDEALVFAFDRAYANHALRLFLALVEREDIAVDWRRLFGCVRGLLFSAARGQ